jgi:hypothetical protein
MAESRNYTYPMPSPYTDAGFEEAVTFFQTPNSVRRRLAEILPENALLTHTLLRDRERMPGGALILEPELAPDETPGGETIAPGGEYPSLDIKVEHGEVVEATKDGGRYKITNESLKRAHHAQTLINRVMTNVVNQILWRWETRSLAAIQSKIAGSYTSPALTDATTAVKTFAAVKAEIIGLKKNYHPQTVVLTESQWVNLLPIFKELLPPNDGSVINDSWPTLLGMHWLRSPYLPAGWLPTVIDFDRFGGIGHEDLSIPGDGYANVGNGTNVEVSRQPDLTNDSFWLQWRKTDVPYVLNADAAIQIDGTGL